MATLTLTVTDEELAALNDMAARYQVTVSLYVMRQLRDFMAETVRDASSARWERRRKKLEADVDLAATVDAAGARAVQPRRTVTRQGRTR